MNMNKLNYDFFNRYTVEVAKDLLGKELVYNNIKAIITETEAYRGYDDPASHAFRGVTPRSKIMFERAGFSYVYLIYGMYNCLNFVTEDIGKAGAVLVRAAKVLGSDSILDGPGKLSRFFGITRADTAIDITSSNNFYLTKGINVKSDQIKISPRIGIKVGQDKLWRFCL